jgi:RNA polymerase sigma-70 factor (ECF subfamily)
MTNEDHPRNVRLQDGDQDAFRELVARHESGLRVHLAARLPPAVRRRVSVADVIQETYVAAFDKREDFQDRGEGAFGPWLRGIAEHRLKKAVRRHAGTHKRAVGREVTRGARPDTHCFAGVGKSPSVAAMSAEEVARIRAARETLPADYRQVIELILEQGLTLREAAECMGRSREATKKLYGRAMVRLRKTISGGESSGS